MDDPRDPREPQDRRDPEPDEEVGRLELEEEGEPLPEREPEPEPDRFAEDRPEPAAEEFESQPSFATERDDGAREVTGDADDDVDDATAAWPAADALQPADEPPPMDAEAYSRPPSEAETYAAAPRDEVVEGEPAVQEPAPSEVEAYASQVASGESDASPAAHTVPATGVGESTRCPRCGTENRPGLAFCRNCGQRLMAAGSAATVERPGTPEGTQACPRCGTHNRAGTAFCQNCGANLRAAETAAAGYVPPRVAEEPAPAAAPVVAEERRHAVLGPIVLLIGAIGLATGWLLPFPYGAGSLYERAAGSGGYGVAFWNGYQNVDAGLIPHAYFGFAAVAPLIVLLVVVLAIAGVVKAAPGRLQGIGLAIALVWSIAVAVLFVVVEVLGGAGSGLADMLRNLSPGGIILFLASLIVLIGTLTRFARG